MTEKENFQNQLSTLVGEFMGKKGISEQEIREILIQEANINNLIIDKLEKFKTTGNEIKKDLILQNVKDKKKAYDSWRDEMRSFIEINLKDELNTFDKRDHYNGHVSLTHVSSNLQDELQKLHEAIEDLINFLENEIGKQSRS